MLICSAYYHSEITEKAADKRPAESSSTPGEAVKVAIKKSQSFVPFSKALSHEWTGVSPKRLRKLSPMLFATLGESTKLCQGSTF